jgi:uncharacterized membrane protein YhhN
VILVFVVLAVVHLVACATAKESLRRATKPLLMPVLVVFYLVAASPVSPLVVLALGLATVGDALLLGQTSRRFFLGGVAFVLGHGLYVALFLRGVPLRGWAGLVAAVVVLVSLWVYAKVRAGLGGLLPGFIAYFALLTALCVAAYARFAALGWAWFPAMLGAAAFYVSDTLLSLDRYDRPVRHGTFWIMATYCLAQSLIVASFAWA